MKKGSEGGGLSASNRFPVVYRQDKYPVQSAIPADAHRVRWRRQLLASTPPFHEHTTRENAAVSTPPSRRSSPSALHQDIKARISHAEYKLSLARAPSRCIQRSVPSSRRHAEAVHLATPSENRQRLQHPPGIDCDRVGLRLESGDDTSSSPPLAIAHRIKPRPRHQG